MRSQIVREKLQQLRRIQKQIPRPAVFLAVAYVATLTENSRILREQPRTSCGLEGNIFV
jgi:hypothetical protein